MSKLTKAQIEEKNSAMAHLRALLQPGGEVHTTVTHVSRSGMSRSIKLYVPTLDDGKPTIEDITYYVGKVLGYKHDQKNGGLKVGGCGMDMCFHLVYSLGRTMWAEGGPLDKTSGVRRNQALREDNRTTIERDGGYLLTKRDL